jgi:hypothetical protein
LLETYQDVPTKRPPLDAPIIPETLQKIVRADNHFQVKNRQYEVEVAGDTIKMREYIIKNNITIKNEYLETTLQHLEGAATVQRIEFSSEGVRRALTPQEFSAEAARYNRLYTGMLNHFAHMRKLEDLFSTRNKDIAKTQEQTYYVRLTNENADELYKEWLAMHRDLAIRKFITDTFW